MFYLAVPKLVGLLCLFLKDEKLIKKLASLASLVTLIGAISTIFLDSTIVIPYIFEEGMSFASSGLGVVSTSIALCFFVYVMSCNLSKLDTVVLLFMEAITLGLVYANELFTSYILLMFLIFVTYFMLRKTSGSVYYLGISILGSLIMLMGMFMTNHTYHSLAFNLTLTSQEFLTYGLVVLGLVLPYIFPFHGTVLKMTNPLMVITSSAVLVVVMKVLPSLSFDTTYSLILALILAILALFSKNNGLNYAFLASFNLGLINDNFSLISVILLGYFGLFMLLEGTKGKASRLIYVFLSLAVTGIAFSGFTSFGLLYTKLGIELFVVAIINGLILGTLIRIFLVSFTANKDAKNVSLLLLNLIALMTFTLPNLSAEVKISGGTIVAALITFGLGLVTSLISKKLAFIYKFMLLDKVWLPLVKFISDILALIARLVSDVVEGIVYVIRNLFFNSVNTRIKIKGNRSFTTYDEDAKYGKIFHEDLGKSLLLISIGIALAMLYMLL